MELGNYRVKNVKSFRGREGLGFEASLYDDKKRIGTVLDSADGGPFFIDIRDKEDLQKLNDFAAKQDAEADILIAALVDNFEFTKIHSKAVLFKEEGDYNWKSIGLRGVNKITEKQREDLIANIKANYKPVEFFTPRG